jgi:hypothetical protein
MNIWWIIITPLSFIWIGPMAAMRQANAPVWVFIMFAFLWSVVAFFAPSMYDWGTNIGRRLGHHRLAALRECLKPKVLPPARAGLIIMAIISLFFAIR